MDDTVKRMPRTVVAAISISSLAIITVVLFYWSVHIETFANSDGTLGLFSQLPEVLLILLCGGLAFVVPCVAVALGFYGFSKITRSPDALKGKSVAILAVFAAVLCMVLQYLLPYHITYVHMERDEAAERLENTQRTHPRQIADDAQKFGGKF